MAANAQGAGHMTRINPFARKEDPYSAAPALGCRPDEGNYCPDTCPRHIDIAGSERAYATFRDRLGDGSAILQSGLFVPVCGPEKTGKTSLLNRCLRLALTTLERTRIPVQHIDLSPFGQSSSVTVEERVLLTHTKALEKTARLPAGVLDNRDFVRWLINAQPGAQSGQAGWQSAETRVFQTFESTMDTLKEALKDRAVLIVVTPRAYNERDVLDYSRGTFEKLVIFTEAEVHKVSDLQLPSSPQARHCLLGLRTLRDKAEVETYLNAHLDMADPAAIFPPLPEDMTTFWGDPPDVPVGQVHALMHQIYDFYKESPPAAVPIKREDVHQVIRKLTEEQEG
jgi:hypothetical protein